MGHGVIDSILNGLTATPFADMICPKYDTDSVPKRHLDFMSDNWCIGEC